MHLHTNWYNLVVVSQITELLSISKKRYVKMNVKYVPAKNVQIKRVEKKRKSGKLFLFERPMKTNYIQNHEMKQWKH